MAIRAPRNLVTTASAAMAVAQTNPTIFSIAGAVVTFAPLVLSPLTAAIRRAVVAVPESRHLCYPKVEYYILADFCKFAGQTELDLLGVGGTSENY